MTTFLAQNQFISNPSVIIEPPTEGSAAASKPPPVADAAAAPVLETSLLRSPPVSPGVSANLCPCGEIEPSVMKAFAPGENLSSSSKGRLQEAPAAAPTKNPDAGVLATDCIHEIFFYVRKLMKQPPRFVLDEARFLAEIEEVPLFLREDGYLQRREA